MAYSFLIRTIEFDDEGFAVVQYCHAVDDMKANGLVHNHLIAIPRGNQYDDQITAIHEAVQMLLADVLEDLPFMPPLPLDDRDDDEDDDEDDDAPPPHAA